MWIPEYIEFKNLFSHEHSLFNFVQGQMLALIGPNGIGKSTIIEAITLAVTGDVYRSVGKSDFVRDGEECAWVSFALRNDALKQTFRIERTVYAGNQSSKVVLYENGKPRKDLADKRGNDPNRCILEKIGIGKQDFLDYFVIGQGNHNSFFGGTDAKQKDIIARFSNADVLGAVEREVSNQINSIDDEIKVVNIELGKKQELISYLQRVVLELQEGRNEQFEQHKQELEIEINECEEEISNVQKTIKNINQYLTAYKKDKKVDVPALTKQLTSLEKLISKREQQLEDLTIDLTQWKTIQQELEVKAGRIVKCPNCKYEFVAKADVTVEEMNNFKAEAESNIVNYKQAVKQAKETISRLQTTQAACEQQLEQHRRDKIKFEEYESHLKICKGKLSLLQDQLAVKQTALANLKVPAHEKEIKQKKQEIQDLEKDIAALEQQEATLLQRKEELLFHQYHFSRKGFKTFLANKSIKNLQDISNFYLNKFKTDLQVQISSFKLTKSGDLRDKIEVSIIKNGRRRGLFHKFSGGEKSRVDLAGIIAVHKLINNSSNTGGLDLLCLDENISYLDREGQQEIINILQQAGITSVLVMHMHEDVYRTVTKSECLIKLEKVNGITKIKQ